TIGTENAAGSTGLQVVYNAAYLHNNLAIKIEKGLAWLDENPSSGTVTPGGSQSVDVIFNSTGLATGVYTGVMNVNSNDPLRPVKTIPVKLTVGVVGVENNVTGIPSEFALNQNYPNPFNPTTNISFAIPTESFVSIKIYDILGKEVSKIVNETKQAGYYNFNFDASSLSSGMYFYKIEAGNFVQTKRMLLMK
ncbi:MAG: T9SS type A sorting domain-containing protein, partial [Ignavibacteriae bacterium]|nr:T9SS type A sorting domain-containing protein [Ignavibacteriota bacterium]